MSATDIIGCATAVFGISAIASVAMMTCTCLALGIVHGDGGVVLASLVRQVEVVADLVVMPALRSIGDAWERQVVSVAGDDAASHAVLFVA